MDVEISRKSIRKKKKKKKKPDEEKKCTTGADEADQGDGGTQRKGVTQRTRRKCVSSTNEITQMKDVVKKDEGSCERFVDYALQIGVQGFRKMFTERLMQFMPVTPCMNWENNKAKNRYADVVCLDETRVKLTQDVPPSGDYIHANYVKFEGYDRMFIATQAPMENTQEDFWRMIYQEQSLIILCLTKQIEDGKIKCSMYWPDEVKKTLKIGKMAVTCKKLETDKDFTIITVEVLPDGCSNSVISRIIFMSGWPDKGLPASERYVLRFIKKIAEADSVSTGPITVHCSAGIGRSGAIILIDVVIHTLVRQQTTVDMDMIEKFFQQLRSCRASAIQKEGQFVFVISCALEYCGARHRRLAEKTSVFTTEFRSCNMTM